MLKLASLKPSFSHLNDTPVEIESIVIVSDIEQVGCHWHRYEKWLEVPVLGYVATSKCVNRKKWEGLIKCCVVS
jgi:hypothetical protein